MRQRLSEMLAHLRKHLGLIVFVIACVIGPAVAQVLVASVPAIPKGTFSLFDGMGSGKLQWEGEEWFLTEEPEILVTGLIRPVQLAESVELEINGQSFEDEPLTLWGPGGFRALVPVEEGENVVLARAPWGSRRAAHILYISDQITPSSRALSVTLATDQASAIYSVSYPRAAYDEGLLQLPTDALSADLFIRRAFYSGQSDPSGSQPLALATEFALEEDAAVVRVKGTLSDSRYNETNVDRILRLTPQLDVPTTVSLNLEQIVVRTVHQSTPTTWRATRLQWIDPTQPIAVEYEPLQGTGATWLQDLWAGIQDAAGRIGRTLNVVALPVVPLVPFLWLLLPDSLRGIGSTASREKRNTLLVLTLLMWLVPITAYVVPFPRILRSLVGDLLLPRYPPELSLWGASLAYAFLLPLAYRITIAGTEGRGGWIRWFALVLGAVLLNLLLLLGEGYLSLLLFPAAALVLLVWAWLMSEISSPGRSRFRKLISSLPVVAGVVVAILVLSYPFSATATRYEPAEGWQLRHWAQFYFILGPLLLPYTIIPAVMPLLKASRSDRVSAGRARPRRFVGMLFFAVYVIGFLGAGFGSVGWIPFNLVPFVIAVLWVYPSLVERSRGWGFSSSEEVQKALDARPDRLSKLRQEQWEAKYGKAAGGQAGTASGLPDDYNVRKAVFTFGPTRNPWENAKLSLGYGVVLTSGLFLLYAPFILGRAGELTSTPFPILQILGVLILPFFAKWLLASFLLGYFFSYIRGNTGLQKGLVLAAGIILCTLPSNALLLGGTMGDPLALLWEAGQTILFLSALGLWAFDWNTARRYGLGWSDVMSAEGLTATAPFLSSLVAAIGGVASSIISGRVDEIIKSVLELLLKGAPPFS
jgi:hypothetical protein